jgi:hypothetical protein
MGLLLRQLADRNDITGKLPLKQGKQGTLLKAESLRGA